MSDWKATAAEKKAKQQALIPKEWTLALIPPPGSDSRSVPESCGLLEPVELEITNSDTDILLDKLAKGEWTSVSVTTAFYKRAIIAHQLTNCLTEIFIEKALARAAEVDEYLKKTGKVIGPLHGLPVSLKDQLNIKGVETSMGYVSWIGQYAQRNSVLTDILESVGAVPFVKTNVPQTLMWPETFNHIFGRTVHPCNSSWTCGGSSGGEGALVAMRGSPMGVGSDIGGSIRIPAAFCGVYGMRPSYGRVPYAGNANSLEGQDSAPSVLGPLSNSLSGVKTFMKAVIDTRPWLKDPLAVRKRWSEDEYNLADHGSGKSLCFAIMFDDNFIVPHPPIIRGMEMVKKALEDAGHKVINWKPLKHPEICRCLVCLGPVREPKLLD